MGWLSGTLASDYIMDKHLRRSQFLQDVQLAIGG